MPNPIYVNASPFSDALAIVTVKDSQGNHMAELILPFADLAPLKLNTILTHVFGREVTSELS